MRIALAITLGAGILGATPTLGAAQVVVPAAIQDRTEGTPSTTQTAEETAFGLALYEMRASAAVPLSVANYPLDSLKRLVTERAASLVRRLQASPIAGIQLDPSGKVSVRGDQESLARTQISNRLATPGLSLDDKGYTLYTAVAAFADADYPQRIPIAEAYLRQVDALPVDADYWKYLARTELIDANYTLGRADAVEQYAIAALKLVTTLPFIDRLPFYLQDISPYLSLADVLSGKRDGATRIADINTQLLAAATAPADLIAVDSGYYFMGLRCQRAIRSAIGLGAMIGKTAPKLVGTTWFNSSHTGPFEQSLNDGKIRIIEFGEVTCAPCLAALPGMQRLANRFANQAEVLYVTNTLGFWGTTFTTPHEEVDSLKAYYTGTRKLTFPISVWVGEKEPTPDGGMLPAESPNMQFFHIFATPTIFVTDGAGRVRRVFVGFGHEEEEQAAKSLRYLINETKPPQSSATPSTPSRATAIPNVASIATPVAAR